MDTLDGWIRRIGPRFALFFALALLLWLCVWTSPQAAYAQDSPSGGGQASLAGSMDVSVGAYQGTLYLDRTDLVFECGDCDLPLGFSLSYNGQENWTKSPMGFYGWRHPFDVYLVDESFLIKGYGRRVVHWGGGATTNFYPYGNGTFGTDPGENDTLAEPQPGQYVLTTCSGLTYYFDTDRHSRPTRVEARNGQVLVLSYDADGELASLRDSYGRQIQFSYDAEGYLTQVTDANVTPARTVHYGHDAGGNLTEVVDALGNSTLYSYDAKHRLTEIRDASGHVLRIVYNADGRVASLVTSFAARHFAYDAAAQTTTVTDMVSGTASQRTVYRFDGRGRVVEVVRDDGLKRTLAWDDDDNPVRVTDEAGQVTTYTYDDKSNITSITDPLSRTVTFTYHPVFYEMTSATDALGRTTTAEYDAKGNVVRVTRPGNRVTTYEYDARGRHVIAITDPLSRATRYGYDAFGHNTVITDATGAVMTYAYDAAGRMLSYSDDNGHTTTFGYNPAGRLTSVTDPLTRTTTYAYDASENLQKISDPAGGIRRYRYDDLNRLLDITDEIGGGISYAYDGLGNTLSVADAHGNKVSYGYDSLNRLTGETDPLGYKTIFGYDALGQMQSRQNPSGQLSTYDRDAAGQLTAEHHPEGSSTYAYDAAGNVVAITTTQVIIRYGYNDADELTSVTALMPGLGINKTVSYTYYDDGMRATMTDPDDGLTHYAYDSRGRIHTITNPVGQTVTYTWDGAGRLTRKDLGNGTYVLYDYDRAGQIKSLAHYQSGGTPLESVEYTYDELGNRTREVHGDGRTVTYTYDAGSRLIAASYSDGTHLRYTYDLAGHRTQMRVDDVTIAYTIDAAGRLQSDGTATYHWDRQGNLSSVQGLSGTITYTFDSRQRLTAVVSPTLGTTAFDYYPDGRPFSRTDPDGTVTLYVYDGPNLLLELDGTGQTLARYTSGGVDDWLILERGGERYTYHADGLGSVLGLSDANGNLVEGYRYTPFGRTQVVDGTGQPLPGSAIHNPFRFTGRQHLGLGELYDYRARIYDAGTGRFLSEDPVGASWDPNRYAYAWNNPTTLIDPSGFKPAGQDIWRGKGMGFSASFLFGCSVWSGIVTNQRTGEQCSIEEKCCSLGGQAGFEVGASSRLFSGPQEGHRLAGDRWNAEVGTTLKLGPILKFKMVLDVDTDTGEHMPKVGLGVSGVYAEGGQSNLSNLSGEVSAKFGAGLTAVGRGQYCRKSVRWCDKKEEKEKEDDEPEEGECGSDTGCCWIGPDCDDPDGASCCYLCCGDGPCDQPDCGPSGPDFPPDGPGGDHPDENFSAASLTLSPVAPLDRTEPYMGLLWRGHAETTGMMINQIGERYEPVGLGFSPSLAERLPVLVIPSGGLYGLEYLTSFRARLASYVELGGTIISFDQQRGAHYGILPSGQGGDRLGGYGWREDNSCFETAFFISNYHPVLSGFDKPTLDVHVDGYFTTLPNEVTELLNRMKNGQPGLVLYPFPASGQGGYVLATTVYDDWGRSYYQGSPDAMTLVRDMLSWAYKPDESLPDFSPGDVISLDVPVNNGTADHAATVELALLRPDRTTAYSQTRLLAVTPGGSVAPTLDWTLPSDAQLGIWWAEYTLRDASGSVLQPRTAGRRLVVSDPSPITGPDRPLSLSITAPSDSYISGSEGEFTFHIYNHTGTQRSVEIRYGLPHHTWEGKDPSYGEFHNLRQTLDVGPNGEATFAYRPILFTTDRLWAALYEGDTLIDNAHFAVFSVAPSVRISPETDKGWYLAGEPVVITSSLQNLGVNLVVDLSVKARDPKGSLVFSDTFTKSLPAKETTSAVVTFDLPATPVWGYYSVQVEAYEGVLVAQGSTRFEVPGTRLRMRPVEPPAYHPGAGNDVDFVLESVGSLGIDSGFLTARAYNPAGSEVWSEVRPFSIAQGQKITVTLPVYLSNEFGSHRLSYQAAYDGQLAQAELELPFSNAVQPVFDQLRYCGGQTMGVNLRVTNSGRFQESLEAVRLEVPAAAYAQDHAVGSLAPSQTATDTHSVPLPPSLGPGTYPLTVTLRLASGSQSQSTSAFVVPASDLAASVPPSAEAGQPLNLTVTNVGCGVTSATYRFSVKKEVAVAATSGTLATLPAGEGQPLAITLPAGATSGTYSVVGVITDTQTGERTPTYEPVAVSGQSALLRARTDQRVYLTTDPISAMATITSTGTPLTGSTVMLQILKTTAAEQWMTHAVGDQGPVNLQIVTLAIDQAGRIWSGGTAGVSVVDAGGTPTDKSDDRWQFFTTAHGLVNDDIKAVDVDADGLKWFATASGLSVFDDGGTPMDRSDDRWRTVSGGSITDVTTDQANYRWYTTSGSGVRVRDDGGTPFDGSDDHLQTFTTGDGLSHNLVHALSVDDANLKWFATHDGGAAGGASVLDDGGTPLDKGDDQWQTFGMGNGMAGNAATSIAVDSTGYKWFGHNGQGVSVLDDGGTPFVTTDDQWQTFTTGDGLYDNRVYALTAEDPNLVWFGHYGYGASVLDHGGTPLDKSDDIWVKFRPEDGLPQVSVWAIASDGIGTRWFGTSGTEMDPVSLMALDDAGTLSDKADDTWQYFSVTDGLVSNWIYDIAFDAAGRQWIAAQGLSVLDDAGTPLDNSDDRWQSFDRYDGLLGSQLAAIAVDGAGYKWMASDNEWNPVSVLDDGGTPFDKSDDVWQGFSTYDGLVYSYISDLVVGPGGTKWFGTAIGASVLDDGATPLDKADDLWETFTSADGLQGDSVFGLRQDEAGRTWFCSYASVSVLDDGGTPFDKADDTWQTFTSSDGVGNRAVYGVAIDAHGRKWFTTYGAGVKLLDDGGTLADKSDDQWLTFTTADGLADNSVDSVGIDARGRKWFGFFAGYKRGVSVLDDGGTPFDKSDDTWLRLRTTDGLAHDDVSVIAVDNRDRKWLGTQGGGLSLLSDSREPLWTGQWGLNPEGTTEVNGGVGTLNTTGKLLLEGVINSTTGQVVARDNYAFYVYDAQTALTLETDRRVYRPGQQIALSGEVQNNSGVALTNQTLTVVQDGATIYTEGPFEVSAGGSHSFAATTSAPGSPGITGFVASVGSILVEDEVQVAAPSVSAALQAPALAGSQPFSLTVVLTNSGEVEATVHVTISGDNETVNLPAGDVRLLPRAAQIAADTTLEVVLSGDLNQTLSHPVVFGEAAEVAFFPDPVSCPGLLEIPYVLTNTGQLEIEFTTYVSVTSPPNPSSHLQIEAYLPLSGTQEGALALALAAGDYTLSWQHPYGTGLQGFGVVGTDQLTVDAASGLSTGYQAPITVTLTNVGCNPFSGTLLVDAVTASGPFCSDEQPVAVALGGSSVYTFALDTFGLPPGIYSATLSLLDGGRAVVGTGSATGDIPAPDLRVSTIPVQTALVASQTVTLTFGVENVGAAGDQANLTFTLDDLEDETEVAWLDAGESGTFTYTFFVPPDLASGYLHATYMLTGSLGAGGDSGDMVFSVDGISVTVDAQADQLAYREGDPATITLAIANVGSTDTSLLEALVSLNGFTQTQTFELAQGADIELEFPLIASHTGDAKVFYGVYFAGTDRSIHLNTFYLRQEQPLVTLLTDKQVYLPGETVVATLVTTMTKGTLSVFAPGYAGTLGIENGAQVSFDLPAPMARGTEAIYYVADGTGTPEDGRERRVPFDVDGPEVFVRSSALREGKQVRGGTTTLDLVVSSDRAVDLLLQSYILYPGGCPGQLQSQPVHLEAVPNNGLVATATLTGTQMGLHRFGYQLVQQAAAGDLLQQAGGGDLLLVESSVGFDAGPAGIIRLGTDQDSYPGSDDPVQARLEIYSQNGGPAQVTLILDDGPTASLPAILDPGFQTLTITLDGPIPAGRRLVTATLQADGQPALAWSRFDYGTSLPDLRPGAPWVAAGGTVTRTLTALVSNEGQSAAPATTVRFYDGAPGQGGTPIGTAAIPALETADQATASLVWDIQGLGGGHTLYVTVDPVGEFDEGNNGAQAAVTLPRLESALAVASSRVEAGEAVVAWVRLENRQAAAGLAVTATVEIRSPHGDLMHGQTWSQALDGAEVKWLHTPWQSEPGAELGTYSVLQEACDAYGECYQHRSSFTVGTEEIRHIHLPLVVRGYSP